MRAANRIKGCIDANSSFAPCGELAHNRDEVASAIVDRRCTVALDRSHVGGRAGADRLLAEMTCQIEQRRSDRARGAKYDSG